MRLTPSSTSILKNNIPMIHISLKLRPTRKHLFSNVTFSVSDLEKTIKNKKSSAGNDEKLCSVSD